MNRILSKAADPYFVTNHIGAASESFTYTATGKRATMADASGTTTYTYDTRNRLATKATPEGTLSYSYDAASDVKTIQSSNTGGAGMAYGYDALDRLASVTDANGATSYGYDNVGNLQTVTYPNGVAHSYTYDTRNRLTNLGVTGTVNSAPGPIASYGYTLDAAGHRLSVSEFSGRKVNYSYDTIYRLTNETIASDPNAMNGAVGYTYDSVGNRLQKTSTLPGFPGAASTYNANDELTTDTYDADGNTVGSGLNTGTSGYVYDFENRLVQQAGIGIVYDADGNRVSKTTANGTTQYLVDDENPTGYAQVMDEVQSSAVTRTYTWGLDLVSEHQTLNSTLTTSYYVFDGHGSVRALTNSAGAVTDTYDYDAFGILTHSTGTTPNSYLFAGEQYDPDLGLYYNRARYLNTSTGRFWTTDSFEGDIQSPLSLHKYLYDGSDPINHIDRSGHEIDELIGGIAIGLAIAAIATVVAYTVLQGPKDPNTIGPIAQNNAKLLVVSALVAITTGNTNLFVRYFGNPPTAARMNTVHDNYENILAYLMHTIQYHKTDQAVFAYVNPRTPDNMWLGPYFFKAPWVGIDSKPGTIVHEVSHLAHITIDQKFGDPPHTAYGEPNAIDLAATDPAKAVANGDNYEYFAERSNLYGDWGAPSQ